MMAIADEFTTFSNFITIVWAKPSLWIESLPSEHFDPQYTKISN
jgi:hypothetical protein